MRRIKNRPSLFLLGILLFCAMSMPRGATDRIRSWTVASLAPAWGWAHAVRDYLFDRPFIRFRSQSSEEASNPRSENQQLRLQRETVHQWLQAEQHLEKETRLLKESPCRRFQQMEHLLERQRTGVAAQVIYRDPTSWSSSVWLNVGEQDNRGLPEPIVLKNSPVVANGCLIGVVEYVGQQQSRVRLITDSGLVPAVRAVRGNLQNREFAELLQAIEDRAAVRADLFPAQGEKEEFLSGIRRLRAKLDAVKEDGYFAKGELYGSSCSFWRSRRQVLKGVGFNCEFPDEEGPARDLRTPILKEGDLLITSGLDGVFPAGLKVAIIAEVSALKEGAYSYDLKAFPAAANINDLQTLLVLPPLGAD